MGQKLIIGVTGASGAIYAKILFDTLQKLEDNQVEEISVVFSRYAHVVWNEEIGKPFEKNNYNFHIYKPDDFFAPFASGSSDYDTMLIVPCSMGTLGRIASGIANDLISRTADVMLKENRKLILMVRETPFNLIHVENMRKIILAGGKIFPAMPSFYHHPQTIENITSQLVLRLLEFSGFKVNIERW